MASSNSHDGVAEPPRKRQRLSPPPQATTSTTTTQGVGSTAAKMEDRTIKTFVSDTGFQPERETQVGILHFVNSENLGFTGTLKQRYTDFLVNEIAPGGSIVHLTDDKVPRFKDVTKEERDKGSKPVGDTTSDSTSINEGYAKCPSEAKPEDVPHLPTPIASEDTFLAASADTETSASVPGEFSATPLPVETPVKEAQKTTFAINLEDHKLLAKYFGPRFEGELVAFHEKILAKPSAKPAVFGSLVSESITDRPLRGRIHQDVRRIFDSRIETLSIGDGKIQISAAVPVKSHPEGYVRKENSRQQSTRNQQKGKLGWQELGGQYLHFSLYKENKDTMEVISFLCKMLKIKPKDFAFAGTKDRRAVTVQRVSVFRQRAENLERLNRSLRQARISDFKYEKHRLELGELEGNQFIITLRDCHFGEDDSKLDETARAGLAKEVVGQAVEHIQTHGFINYFGLQRFGTFGIGTDEVGKKILKDDFEGAVWAILSFSRESLAAAQNPENFVHDKISRDDLDRAMAIDNFKMTGRSNYALERLPRKFSGESQIIRHLGTANGRSDYSGALLTVNRNLRTMYVHAYQSLVWNVVASERWARYGSKIVQGDLVLVDSPAEKATEDKDEVDENGEIVIHPSADDVAVSHEDLFQRARPLSGQEIESGRYTIFDIVLPTPGFDVEYPSNDIGDFYKEFMGSERGGGLDPADMRRKIKDFSLSGSYRKLLAQVGKDLSFEIKSYKDENEQLVETDLEKMQKVRGQNPHPENAPLGRRNDENSPFSHGPRNSRGGLKNSHGGRGGRQNDFFNNGSNERQQGQENTQPPRQERSSFRDRPKMKESQDLRLSAWQNLPAKLAADDKAAAAAYEAQKLIPKNPNHIEQPTYKDTFIETSAEDEGRRSGYRSTEILGDTNSKDVVEEKKAFESVSAPAALDTVTDGLKEELTPASAPDIIMKDPKAALAPESVQDTVMEGTGPTSEPVLTASEVENQFSISITSTPVMASAKLGTEKHLDTSFDDFINESNDGGARLSAQGSSSKLSVVENDALVAEISIPASAHAETEPVLNSNSPRSEPEPLKPTLNPESPTFEPEPQLAKIAVILKFSLGTSQYATMALRELMKLGGVKTYKPDFSMGR